MAKVTKMDVSHLATKEDLTRLATKEDLAKFSTKDDLVVFRDEIIKNFKMISEDAREKTMKAAEGYAATLERVERELAGLNRKFDEKNSDADSVLADYGKRLARLERKRI